MTEKTTSLTEKVVGFGNSFTPCVERQLCSSEEVTRTLGRESPSLASGPCGNVT